MSATAMTAAIMPKLYASANNRRLGLPYGGADLIISRRCCFSPINRDCIRQPRFFFAWTNAVSSQSLPIAKISSGLGRVSSGC